MQYLNIVLGLLSKTSSRDIILRFVQYATLRSIDHIEKGALFNFYNQMRKTRKVLRFLRTIQVTSQLRKEVSTLKKEMAHNNKIKKAMFARVLLILQHFFTLLFYLFDHRVFLGELQVIDKTNVELYYPLSMKMYGMLNIFGALKCLAQLIVVLIDGKYQDQLLDIEKGKIVLKKILVELLRSTLDIFIANYCLNKPVGKAKKYGVIGMITSAIGIAQALGKL